MLDNIATENSAPQGISLEMEDWNYRTPPGYQARLENAKFVDVPSEIVYQPHVYALAQFLAKRSCASRIVDIGCGSGEKLAKLVGQFEIFCVDNAEGIALARKSLPSASFLTTDLENGLFGVNDDVFKDAIVICADVLEHLKEPEHLAKRLAEIDRLCRFMLISTPDRARARGLLHGGPPENPAHVREWTADEFGRFLLDCGLSKGFPIGHTINNDVIAAKATTLVIGGKESRPRRSSGDVKVAAIIHAYNEADIIEEVVRHLGGQSVEAHVFDNWSTDGTFELLTKLKSEGLCKHVSRWPDRPTTNYEWRRMLEVTSRYAASLDVDWVMHHDADEIRLSPWAGVSIRDAFKFVDSIGYNAVDFTVIEFRFVNSNPNPSPPFQKSLTRFEFGLRPGCFRQIKAWKNTKEPASLAESGGHIAGFPNRRVFPLKFLMKHYPLRGEDQANLKIFTDRAPRTATEKAQYGWHTHYDNFVADGIVRGWEPRLLIPWQGPIFDSEFLVERLSGIGLFDDN